jgi:chaperonin GroES
MKIKPLADRIVVKPSEAEEKTASGIIIPDTAKEKPMQGEIIAVGQGRVTDSGTFVKLELKVGDKVLYGKYSGTEVTVDGNEYLIMRESDVYTII